MPRRILYSRNISLVEKNGWDGHWIDAASTLRLEESALIVLDPLNGKAIDKAYSAGIKTWVGGNCTVSLMLLAIQGLIEKGIEEGAELVSGGPGKPEGLNAGYYVRPTVFANVNNDMTIAKEEIFGPVISIIPFSNEEEAVKISNELMK